MKKISLATAILLALPQASIASEVEVKVQAPKPYSYEPLTVRQLEVRGSTGRYLIFLGRTQNAYAGSSATRA